MPSALLVACAALTAARLTRLITRDVFPPIRWAREWVEDHGPEWLVDLVTCVWCASAHISAGVVALLWLAPKVATPVLMFGAVWAVSSTLAYWQGRAEDAESSGMATLETQVGVNGQSDLVKY